MGAPNRSRLLAGAGIVSLIAALILFYASVPAYTTEIEAKASGERALAAESERYSASEIDAIRYANLSTAEQTAFERARQSSERRYADRGHSDEGATFEYRNDVINQYFVDYDGNLYSVTTVVEIDPLVRAGSVVSGIAAVGLLAFAAYRYQRDRTA